MNLKTAWERFRSRWNQENAKQKSLWFFKIYHLIPLVMGILGVLVVITGDNMLLGVDVFRHPYLVRGLSGLIVTSVNTLHMVYFVVMAVLSIVSVILVLRRKLPKYLLWYPSYRILWTISAILVIPLMVFRNCRPQPGLFMWLFGIGPACYYGYLGALLKWEILLHLIDVALPTRILYLLNGRKWPKSWERFKSWWKKRRMTKKSVIVLVLLALIMGGGIFFMISHPSGLLWLVECDIHDVGDLVEWLASLPDEIIHKDDPLIIHVGPHPPDVVVWPGEESITIIRVGHTRPIFYVGEPIVVYADLEGIGNFDHADGNLSPSCAIMGDNVQATVTPSIIPLWYMSNSKEGFECEFPPYEIIDEPKKTVEVVVDFPWESTANTTLVFMEDDYLKQLRREEKDPNDIYDFPEEPATVSQPGPAMVGLGTVRSNPIGVSSDKAILTRVGFTLKNEWDGEIANIVSVELTLDEGLCLPVDENNIEIEGPDCGAEGKKTYMVPSEYLEKYTDGGEDPIETFTHFQFRMQVDSSVLGDEVIAPKKIEAKVKYDYRLRGNTSINLDYRPAWEET